MSPCIRGLSQFKKGCPEKVWNGKEGCPAWVEMSIPDPENIGKHKIEKKCLDLWYFTFQWAALSLLEGNQKAVESFRNASCEIDPNDPFNDNKARPKASKAEHLLLQMVAQQHKMLELV